MATRNAGSNGSGTGRAYAHIVGWGMAVPEAVLTNDDISAFVETDDTWIRERTGIRERRIAGEKESAATLGYNAARHALEVADILPVDLDLIVVATSTPEHVFPGTASLIQDWLGASRAGAFDLSAACSGFVYAIDMAAQSIRSGSMKTALVIGTETMSRVMDWQDRSTCILFGDGAGAVVLRASEQPGGVLASVLRSDGAGCDLLAIPTTSAREPGEHKLNKMYMAGSEVFKFATRVVDEGIRQCLDKAGLELDDISLIVPHQANQRILASVAKKLRLDINRFMSNVERYGNTSAASIPIALCEALEQKRIKPNDHIVLVGFGGGLTWAATVIQWVAPSDAEPARFNRQRRQFLYTFARWRRRITQLQRSLNNLLYRLNPRRRRRKTRSGRENDDLS
ncbi:MAG: ketoacyl-ACP synthase III [Anaerolineae bacterium]|nr:ketoacyl-ACP synthase III [Anaerolineae bacterium]